MVSKKKFMTTLATSVALASISFTTVGQVVPQLGAQVQTAQAATSAINDFITNNNIQLLTKKVHSVTGHLMKMVLVSRKVLLFMKQLLLEQPLEMKQHISTVNGQICTVMFMLSLTLMKF